MKQTDCPLGTDARARSAASLQGVLPQRLDAQPVPTGDADGRRLGESLATTGVIAAMYDEGAWPQLREALTDGDARRRRRAVCSPSPTATTSATPTARTPT